MRILLSNDDGYSAPGLQVLAEALVSLGQVTVVAPDRDRSGASNSLTLDRPLRLHRANNGFYYVNGTPTDCVHLAVTGMLEHVPDLVVSGINLGTNMGDDTIYSGTVAAAMEGYLLGVPSIAVSLASKRGNFFATAAQVARRLVERLQQQGRLREPMLLNVNVPDLPDEQLSGIQVTRLGRRHKAESAVAQITPRQETVYWIGAAGNAADAGPGTDFNAVANDFVSITPLQVDLTDQGRIRSLQEWLA